MPDTDIYICNATCRYINARYRDRMPGYRAINARYRDRMPGTEAECVNTQRDNHCFNRQPIVLTGKLGEGGIFI